MNSWTISGYQNTNLSTRTDHIGIKRAVPYFFETALLMPDNKMAEFNRR